MKWLLKEESHWCKGEMAWIFTLIMGQEAMDSSNLSVFNFINGLGFT